MANVYKEVKPGTDWRDIPKGAYLAVGTELTYKGCRIRLVKEEQATETCSKSGCIFWDSNRSHLRSGVPSVEIYAIALALTGKTV